MWPFSKIIAPIFQPAFVFPSSSTAIDKFVTYTLASGLVNFGTLIDACADFDAGRTDESAVADLQMHLVERRVLTDWQCNKLKNGQFKGFYLDGYCLLSQIGKTDRLCIYSAREVTTGKIVALDVTPLSIDPIKDGKIHYKVRDLDEAQSAGE